MSVTPLADAWQYPLGDPGIVLFTEALKAWRFDLPEGARVLELGCCESEWAQWLLRARPDVQVTGIDVRACPGYPGIFSQGDAAHMLAPEEQIDAVFAIGSIEHFGLGWPEYGDPVNPSGDADAFYRAAAALKPGGLIYFDVPWTPGDHFATEHWRCYSELSLVGRLYLSPKAHCENWMVEERARGWAPNADEHAFTHVRPLVPMQPFYFTARWLTKVA